MCDTREFDTLYQPLSQYSCHDRCGHVDKYVCSCDDMCYWYRDCCYDYEATCLLNIRKPGKLRIDAIYNKLEGRKLKQNLRPYMDCHAIDIKSIEGKLSITDTAYIGVSE